MLREYLRLALKTLSAYRMRSTLTVLSIMLGVTAVILLTSVAESGLATLSKGIEDVGGTRFIMLWADAPKKAAEKKSDYLKGLTYADAEALKAQIPLIDKLTALYQDTQVSVRRPGAVELRTDLVGTDSAFLDAFKLVLAKGRNLLPVEFEDHARVAVIGEELAKKLFPSEEAVGKELVLKGDRYRIIGQLGYVAHGGMNFGFSWNDLAIVPLTVVQPGGGISMATLTSHDPRENAELLDRANAILLVRHNDLDDFQFMDFGGMLKGFYAVFFAMILIVGLISGMSLVIGGVGIMNIMLVAVTERRREIGLRKAIGARPDSIMRQFLMEAVVLSLFGAGLGTVLGLGLSELATLIGPMINRGWVGIVSRPAILLAVLASGAVGLFFGWYPAQQAAKLDPILCLRSE